LSPSSEVAGSRGVWLAIGDQRRQCLLPARPPISRGCKVALSNSRAKRDI
jgi:hypothetical protein